MIDRELDSILKCVEKPARYIGGEVNIVRKDPDSVDVRMGFAFPDTYEIGMSYMGMQILYHILNKNERISCERLFAPAGDMETLMREKGRKLYTYRFDGYWKDVGTIDSYYGSQMELLDKDPPVTTDGVSVWSQCSRRHILKHVCRKHPVSTYKAHMENVPCPLPLLQQSFFPSFRCF